MESAADGILPVVVQIGLFSGAAARALGRRRRRRGEYRRAMDEFKRAIIEHALRRTEGNRTEAAKLLGIQRAYLYRLMQRLRVEAPRRVASAGDSG